MGGFNLAVLQSSAPLLLEGFARTIGISALSLLLGALLGVVLCAGRISRHATLRWCSSGFIDFFRTIPEMIPVIWLYACAPFLFRLQLDAMTIGIVALSLIGAAFLAEVFRAGLLAVPQGQKDAAQALGLSRFRVLLLVVGPQAARVMMPPAMNVVADIIKCSSLLSVIGVAELAYEAATLSASSYRYMELYTAAGVLYFVLIFPISLLARRYGERVQRG
ncbi:amino acid ABC transporter permease [Ancylobacter sp. A5.8]|uniref:amino acid ABC transporter permease n=1 Tax=Ancylobacter gelatini TaxID=2919920 RepID=UPI001F4ED6F0|nr:amino acid ABC transporter permease [Ancylobacter gelatini]MCJ8142857.1 amino acid ABC transporter permease [Ancylobacter gelatini]